MNKEQRRAEHQAHFDKKMKELEECDGRCENNYHYPDKKPFMETLPCKVCGNEFLHKFDCSYYKKHQHSFPTVFFHGEEYCEDCSIFRKTDPVEAYKQELREKLMQIKYARHNPIMGCYCNDCEFVTRALELLDNQKEV